MNRPDDVVMAIVVDERPGSGEDRAVALPLYLSCLEIQTFPAERIHLYLRAVGCSDEATRVLRRWIDTNGRRYKSVVADLGEGSGDAVGLHRMSVGHALRLGCHYFVVDVNSFIIPTTLERLVDSGLPVVAPLLRTVFTDYTNFAWKVDADQHALPDRAEHTALLTGKVRGEILVDAVHSTYFVRTDAVEKVRHGSGIVWRSAQISHAPRTPGVGQYLDNRQIYGLFGFMADEPAERWGRFDHVDFTARIVNLANSPVNLGNEMETW